jgi:16S rRNA (adenine1518-N6/adenine1519-N6)-dimethyltransferase
MASYGRRRRPRFSQNFLRDRSIIAHMVEVIDPTPDEILAEIGPGLGALTAPLLRRVAHLHVVEIDTELAAALRRRFAGENRLEVHPGDALGFDFTSLVSNAEHLRVVGNLPYHISTPLLFHLFAQLAVIQDMHFMLQRELVQRIVASPGGRTYGRLSVMTQFYCTVEKLFDVSPGAFHPIPKVASALLRLVPRREPPAPLKDHAALEKLVGRAFSQRRKTLRNSLKPWIRENQIRGAGVDPNRRPETLTLVEFTALANTLAQSDI